MLTLGDVRVGRGRVDEGERQDAREHQGQGNEKPSPHCGVRTCEDISFSRL